MDKSEFKKMFKELLESGEIDIVITKDMFGDKEIRVNMDGKRLDKNRPDGYYEAVHSHIYD